jgi:hypothetical protein
VQGLAYGAFYMVVNIQQSYELFKNDGFVKICC